MELDFDKVFKIPATALSIVGSHPYIKRDVKWLLKSVLMHSAYSLLFYLILYTLIYQDFKVNNFTQTCKDCVLAIMYILVTMQHLVLLYHKNYLLNLINFVNNDYKLKNLSIDEQIIVKKYSNRGLYVCKLWLILITAGYIAFPLKHLILTLYYYCLGEFKIVPPYPFVYPGSIERNKENIFVFLLIYIYLNASTLYGAIIYLAYVPLGPIIILHACGQLEIVKYKVDRLFRSGDINEEIVRTKLKYIVKHQQYINSFVNIIMDVFKVSYDVILKAFTLVLPVTAYEVLETMKQGEFSLEFISFVFGGVLISTFPCYYSQLLMEKGEAVRLSIYASGWELNYDRRTRTTLLILLQYGLRPIAIRTVFRTLSLETLTDIFQQSFAIFNFMNTMWK